MHVVVHFAECDVAAIKLAEGAKFEGNVPILDPRYRKHGESDTLRLTEQHVKLLLLVVMRKVYFIHGFLYG